MTFRDLKKYFDDNGGRVRLHEFFDKFENDGGRFYMALSGRGYVEQRCEHNSIWLVWIDGKHEG